MSSTPEKTVILASSVIGSVLLFSTALDSINKISLTRNDSISDENHNKLFVINGLTMIFSGLAFSYFTFVAIK